MTTYPFQLKPLPYPYEALEPYIDTETMHLHHDKHLKKYVDTLNNLLSLYPSLQSMTLEQLIKNPNALPYTVREDILNNAGGVYNHNLFFDIMGGTPEDFDFSQLEELIKNDFHTLDLFKNFFTDTALKQFGSGYAWLVMNCKKQLLVIKTPNQNTPLSYNLKPILLVDVWEHAYYLKYKNERKMYVENWFNTINWMNVQRNYMFASCT